MSMDAFDAAVDITIAALQNSEKDMFEDGGHLVADFFETVYYKLEELEPHELQL